MRPTRPSYADCPNSCTLLGPLTQIPNLLGGYAYHVHGPLTQILNLLKGHEYHGCVYSICVWSNCTMAVYPWAMPLTHTDSRLPGSLETRALAKVLASGAPGNSLIARSPGPQRPCELAPGRESWSQCPWELVPGQESGPTGQLGIPSWARIRSPWVMGTCAPEMVYPKPRGDFET